MSTSVGSPWLGFVIDRERRPLKGRKVRFATRHLGVSYEAYCQGRLSFAEFDARRFSAEPCRSLGIRQALADRPQGWVQPFRAAHRAGHDE